MNELAPSTNPGPRYKYRCHFIADRATNKSRGWPAESYKAARVTPRNLINLIANRR